MIMHSPYRTRPVLIKGLIFDCDGVLLDSRAANIHLYNYLLKKLGKPPLVPTQEDYVHMYTFNQSLDFIFSDDEKKAALAILKKDRWIIEYNALLKVEHDLIPLLARLKSMNIDMAICTNRAGSMTEVLDAFNLRGFFNPIQTASDASPKPSPDGLLQIITAWGHPKTTVAYIGDSQVDMQAAQAAGMPFWAYRNDKLDAELYLDRFSELQGWLA